MLRLFPSVQREDESCWQLLAPIRRPQAEPPKQKDEVLLLASFLALPLFAALCGFASRHFRKL